jgi:hypothetical protein
MQTTLLRWLSQGVDWRVAAQRRRKPEHRHQQLYEINRAERDRDQACRVGKSLGTARRSRLHEAFRRRLEVLEEARRLANGPAQTININFLYGDGSPVQATVARTVDRSFECLRLEGEDADAIAVPPISPGVKIFASSEANERSIL